LIVNLSATKVQEKFEIRLAAVIQLLRKTFQNSFLKAAGFLRQNIKIYLVIAMESKYNIPCVVRELR